MNFANLAPSSRLAKNKQRYEEEITMKIRKATLGIAALAALTFTTASYASDALICNYMATDPVDDYSVEFAEQEGNRYQVVRYSHTFINFFQQAYYEVVGTIPLHVGFTLNLRKSTDDSSQASPLPEFLDFNVNFIDGNSLHGLSRIIFFNNCSGLAHG